MKVLSNPRHERFAQELAKGKTQEAAYKNAGYRPNKSAASRLSENVNLCERVAYLQGRAAIKVEWDIADALKELEEARELASKAETVQASAMVTATMSKAKLLGMVVDQKEIAGKNGTPLAVQYVIPASRAKPVGYDTDDEV